MTARRARGGSFAAAKGILVAAGSANVAAVGYLLTITAAAIGRRRTAASAGGGAVAASAMTDPPALRFVVLIPAHDEELVLGLFGRLVPEKGVTDAVELLGRMHKMRPTRLVVVGSGPEEARARARATALGVGDRLELLPWQSTSELAATYRTTHVVLVPSRPTETWVEQFGRVIVEAQASGAIVAGYASGSIPEVAGEAAVLTEVGAVAQLADRIAALVANPQEFAHRRTKGIVLSRTRTWSQVAERHAALYRRVAAGEVERLRLPGSPKRRREAARREFDPTAATVAGTRPFALPLLRRGGHAASALGKLLDACAELTGRRGGRAKPGA